MALLTCPKCAASMRELRRNGASLDVCSACRGVWLDPGELETLVNTVVAQRIAAFQAKVAADRANEDRGLFGGRRDDDDDESTLELLLNVLK